MNMKRWTAILLIFCLAICGMTACKSKDDKKSASAGGYVEGAPEDGGDNYEIIGNQGGGNHVTEDNDIGGTTTPDPDTDTDDGNNEKPDDQPNNNIQKPDPDEGKDNEQKPDNEPIIGGDDDEDEKPDVKYKDGNLINILDYNLRCADDIEVATGGTIKVRAERFREVMKKYNPDICGFQEVVPKWVDCLNADYPTYGKHIEYRATNSLEGTMVMWNTATMEELEHGHFWLSPTPEIMSSGDAAWGKSGFYRIVAWAKVKVKATGSTFIYFSTHQNNAGTHPENSAKTILSYARKFGVGTKFGGFCMGDYNVKPWEPGYTGMLEGGIFGDIKDDLQMPDETTVGGYHTDTPASGNIIDFVFYTPAKVAPIHYEVVDMEVNGGYVSDHKGIFAQAALLY